MTSRSSKRNRKTVRTLRTALVIGLGVGLELLRLWLGPIAIAITFVFMALVASTNYKFRKRQARTMALTLAHEPDNSTVGRVTQNARRRAISTTDKEALEALRLCGFMRKERKNPSYVALSDEVASVAAALGIKNVPVFIPFAYIEGHSKSGRRVDLPGASCLPIGSTALIFADEFIQGLSAPQRRGVWAHELGHLVLGHYGSDYRYKLYGEIMRFVARLVIWATLSLYVGWAVAVTVSFGLYLFRLALSRRKEYAAHRFSLKVPDTDLKGALEAMTHETARLTERRSRRNLLWHSEDLLYTHGAFFNRATALDDYARRSAA